MRTVLCVVVLAGWGCALAGRLESTYLPPPGPGAAGQGGAPFVRTSEAASLTSRSGSASRPALIIKQLNDSPGDGSYSFSYETENGIQAEEQGQLREDGAEGTAAVRGAYAFTAPDNVRYSVSYTADENGFQAYGEHLPTAPPVPAAILKALEDNAADEARGVVDDGQYRAEPLSVRSGFAQQSQSSGYHY